MTIYFLVGLSVCSFIIYLIYEIRLWYQIFGRKERLINNIMRFRLIFIKVFKYKGKLLEIRYDESYPEGAEYIGCYQKFERKDET